MEVITFGKTLEIARERLVTLVVGDIKFKISCTPENLRELAIGFLVSEGLIKKGQVRVNVKGDLITVESVDLQCKLISSTFKVRSSGSPGLFGLADNLPIVSAKETFTIDECQHALSYLETEWYLKTKAYHTAALVSKNGLVVRAYDVGRHNAIDKVIGMGIEANLDFDTIFLLISGRISEGMVTKCARAGIPLLVSKAAILDCAIPRCEETGLSAISFTTGIAVKGQALVI